MLNNSCGGIIVLMGKKVQKLIIVSMSLCRVMFRVMYSPLYKKVLNKLVSMGKKSKFNRLETIIQLTRVVFTWWSSVAP